jgi:Fanconi anemia group M protein
MKIIVDFQEGRNCLIEYLREEVEVEIKKLKVGDFIISKDVVVERKTVDDFVNSLIDRRLFKQAENMQKNYSCPIFIIEGDVADMFARNISERAIWSAIISLMLKNNAKFLFTSSFRETAQVLCILAKKEQVECKKELSLRCKTNKMSLKEKQQFFIEGLPGVGPKLAKNLLKKFKSPKGVIIAKEDDLKKVEKLGPKKSKEIQKIIRGK